MLLPDSNSSLSRPRIGYSLLLHGWGRRQVRLPSEYMSLLRIVLLWKGSSRIIFQCQRHRGDLRSRSMQMGFGVRRRINLVASTRSRDVRI
jgi:hypothetical protein